MIVLAFPCTLSAKPAGGHRHCHDPTLTSEQLTHHSSASKRSCRQYQRPCEPIMNQYVQLVLQSQLPGKFDRLSAVEGFKLRQLLLIAFYEVRKAIEKLGPFRAWGVCTPGRLESSSCSSHGKVNILCRGWKRSLMIM
jgi:hypothetical protein